MGFLHRIFERFRSRRKITQMLLGRQNPLLGGFHWSLYITRNEKELVYAMHEHSVIRIVGYVMGYFKNGQTPVQPWSLYLNFNKQHRHIPLRSEHFTTDGENVSRKLMEEIEAIDPGYHVRGAEPIFLEARTRRRIKISEPMGYSNIEIMLQSVNKQKEPTFFSIMDEVFGKNK